MTRWMFLIILAAPAMADWTAHYRAGESFLSKGGASAAVQELRLGLRQAQEEGATASSLAVLYDALGRASFRGGQYRDAKKYFERSLAMTEAQPESRAPVLANLGQASQALGEHALAEQLYRQVLQIAPNRAGIWQSLGAVLLLQRRYDDAESALRKAMSLSDPQTDAAIRNDLASVLEARGKLREAIALLQESLPNAAAGQAHARMLANLGSLYLKLGNRADAVTALQHALAEMEAAVGPSHPDTGGVLREYGRALEKTGRKPEAKVVVKRAEAILSTFAPQTNTDGATVDYRDLK